MKAIVFALVCTGSAGFALHGAPFHARARTLSASSGGGEVDDSFTGKSFSRRSVTFGTAAVGLTSIIFPGQAMALTVAERKRIVAEKLAKKLEDPNSAESKAAASKAARAAKEQERLAKNAADRETALARRAASAEKQAAQRALLAEQKVNDKEFEKYERANSGEVTNKRRADEKAFKDNLQAQVNDKEAYKAKLAMMKKGQWTSSGRIVGDAAPAAAAASASSASGEGA